MIPPHFFTMTLPRSTKGNDGRGAARRRRLRQQLTAIVSCVFTLVLMALFWEPDEATGAAGRHLSSSLRNRLDSIRSRVARQGGLKKAGQGGLGKEDNNNNKLSTNNRLNDILTGKLQLVDVQVRSNARVQKDGSYEGVHGEFCHVDWASHKKDPSTTPMFRDVVAGSPDCEDDRVSMDLQEVMEAVSQFDQGEGVDNPNGQIHLLDLGGFVFHESRCGSTLVANVLQAMYPEKHRVYSESAPPLGLVRAFERAGLPDEHASTVLKDVIYLMGRSNDPKETHVFFKIQSIGATRMKVFLEAFPDTPFMFVYRDPVQVMVRFFPIFAPSFACLFYSTDRLLECTGFSIFARRKCRKLCQPTTPSLAFGTFHCTSPQHSSAGRGVGSRGFVRRAFGGYYRNGRVGLDRGTQSQW